MNFELESYDINYLKQYLKPYQIELIDKLLENNTSEEAIEKYLSANGPTNTIQFGGNGIERNPKPFNTKFREEFDKFICGHPDYKDFYPKVKEGTSIPVSAIISSIAAALGAKFGISAAMISPVIVLALSLLGTMSRRAYCSVRGYPINIEPEKKQ